MSKKHAKNNSLSEKLSSLILAKPSLVESEDEDLTTVDKITGPENDSDFSADELDVPKFRKLNNQLLEEEDAKYSGKGVSRRDLRDTGSVVAEEEAFDEGLPEDEVPEEEDLDSEEEGNDEDKESSALEAEDSAEENVPENRSKNELTGQKPKAFKNNNDALNPEMISKAVDDIEKGKGIKNQLHIWDFLLECRMKFQKSLDAANQLPSFRNFHKFSEAGGPEFQYSVSETKKSIEKMLKSFLNLQKGLLQLNEDYCTSSLSDKTQNVGDDSDSEISSDTDNEQTFKKKPEKISNSKLKDINDFSQEISKRHKEFETYRNNTIQKWNDKTRFGYISSKNFSAFELPTLKQIEHVLLDKPRLIKKTQTKRSIYHILGEEDEPSQKISKLDSEISLVSNDKNKTLYKEIFDDNDFYHQLLSELVKKKSVEITDPVQLGRHWLQLQKIRSKLKKVVDTKASKGRKIRYVVHPKLVNFMMPVDNTVYNEESRVELFNSLFGKK